MVDFSVLLPLAPVAGRSLLGWAKNSWADGKLQGADLKKLGVCFLRLGSLAVFAYFGLGELGFDVSATGSASLAGLIDVLRNDVFNK